MNRAERRRAKRHQRKAAAKKDPDALFAEALALNPAGDARLTVSLASVVESRGRIDAPIPLYGSAERFWQSEENAWTDVAVRIAARLDEQFLSHG